MKRAHLYHSTKGGVRVHFMRGESAIGMRNFGTEADAHAYLTRAHYTLEVGIHESVEGSGALASYRWIHPSHRRT